LPPGCLFPISLGMHDINPPPLANYHYSEPGKRVGAIFLGPPPSVPHAFQFCFPHPSLTLPSPLPHHPSTLPHPTMARSWRKTTKKECLGSNCRPFAVYILLWHHSCSTIAHRSACQPACPLACLALSSNGRTP
jgi:hypothetical protein